MILIAEAGATKTEWVEIKSRNRFICSGMNPNSLNEYKLKNELENLFSTDQKTEIKHIFFYGSGCGSEANKKRIHIILSQHFKNTTFSIATDMEATSIALWGNKKGISAILGTGANLWYWNGNKVTDKIPSLGYILGDEGSGASIGKKLLHDIYLNLLPKHIIDDFKTTYPISLEELIQRVYHSKNVSNFLASFAPFIEKHINEPSIYAIIEQGFSSFFHNYMPFIQNIEKNIGFCGSIAFHFSEQLQNTAKQYSFNTIRIIKSAMPKLIEYHTQKK